MNASQRRTSRRAIVSALASVGIRKGEHVARKAPGKSAATVAVVEAVTFTRGSLHPEVQVLRKDRQSAYWMVRDLVSAFRLRNVSKGHALRLSA